MDIPAIVLFAGILIFAAHFFAWLFSFTKVPDVLLLIGVGMLLGPVLGVLTPDFFGQAGGLFSIVVLAIILFEGGIDLRLDVLKEAWGNSLKLTFLNLLFVFIAVGVPLWLFSDLGATASFMLAAIVSGTASVIIIPLLNQLVASQRSRTIMLVEAALTDVTSIVLTIALLQAYELGSFSAAAFAGDVLMSFVIAAVLGMLAGLAWSILLNKIRHIQNSIFTTPASVFILFGLVELLGFSGPIAALTFGIAMGNIVFFKLYLERRHVFLHTMLHPMALNSTERLFFSEVVFLLQTFFFVFVGMSITFGNAGVLMWGAVLVALMFLVRIPAVRLAVPAGVPRQDAALMSVMVPIGLAAAVLAGLPAQRGIPGGVFMQDVVYAMILFSVLATAVLIFLVSKTPVGRLYQRLAGKDMPVPEPVPSSPNLAG